MTIHAARLFDGKGRVVPNATIEVTGTKITAIDQRPGPYTHDLGDVTLAPGLIDVHVHLNWYFSENGKYQGGNDTAAWQTDAVLDNARAMLMAEFTTVQSLGAASDKPLRDAIARTKDFGGVTGKITIDEQRNATKSAVILTVKNGQFKFVEAVEP